MRRGSFAGLIILLLTGALGPGCGSRREPLKPPSYLLRGGQGKNPSPVIKHLQQESKRLAQAGRGGRYFSPATPKRRKLGRAIDVLKETESAPSSSHGSSLTAPRSGLDSPVSELKAEILSVVVEDPGIAGSYRLQLCVRESFDRIFFDKTYEFMAEVDFIKDLHDKGVEPGPYWIRVAFVDLLGFAHPFSKPKRYILK